MYRFRCPSTLYQQWAAFNPALFKPLFPHAAVVAQRHQMRRQINLVASGHMLDTPTQHTVYHRGNHKVIDVTNAVIPGGFEEIDREGRRLLDAMAGAARDAGANVLMTHIEVFDGTDVTKAGAKSPPGFASVVLLDESHLSAHCYASTGLLAIDAFTCGSDPSATDRIVEKVEKLVGEMFPAASIEIKGMRRFGHFDIPRYIGEYYAEVSQDNQNLLRFHHGAYKKVAAATGDKKLSILEVGGGPTVYQLLSASRHAHSVYFTDLLQTNIDYVEQYNTGVQAPVQAGLDWPIHDWSEFSDFVAALEAEDGLAPTDETPMDRLRPLMNRFALLDVSGRRNDISEKFDVVSAHFVFESSADPTRIDAWGEHLENAGP